MDRKLLGNKGEELAEVLLISRGYDIVARNYGTKSGEIDIIAFKDGILVFCEVKTRVKGIYGDGREAVDRNKQTKIRKSAETFMMSSKIKYDYVEFHVIEITLEHLKDCF